MATDISITERYAAALGDGVQTHVVGAMGLADRRLTTGWVPTGPDEGYHIPKAPLAVALTRLFTGSNSAAHEIVRLMADMIFERSWRIKAKISRPVAHDLACSVLAFHRNGTCRSCGGHGFELILGTPAHSERHCKACGGAGKVPLERIVSSNGQKPELAEMARWLLCVMEAEAGRAAPEAFRALAEKMEL
jgi:hypothetical protein